MSNVSFARAMRKLHGLVNNWLPDQNWTHSADARKSYADSWHYDDAPHPYYTLQNLIAWKVGWMTERRLRFELMLTPVPTTAIFLGYGALWKLYADRAVYLYEKSWVQTMLVIGAEFSNEHNRNYHNDDDG